MTELTTVRSFSFDIYLDTDRPTYRPVNAIEGDSLSLAYTIRDRKGAKYDLTGVTATLKIERLPAGDACGLGYGGTVEKTATVDAANGIVTAAFDLDSDLPATVYSTQLKLTKAGDTISVPASRIYVGREIP